MTCQCGPNPVVICLSNPSIRAGLKKSQETFQIDGATSELLLKAERAYVFLFSLSV